MKNYIYIMFLLSCTPIIGSVGSTFVGDFIFEAPRNEYDKMLFLINYKGNALAQKIATIARIDKAITSYAQAFPGWVRYAAQQAENINNSDYFKPHSPVFMHWNSENAILKTQG